MVNPFIAFLIALYIVQLTIAALLFFLGELENKKDLYIFLVPGAIYLFFVQKAYSPLKEAAVKIFKDLK